MDRPEKLMVLHLLRLVLEKSTEGVVDTLHTVWYDFAGDSDIVLGSDEQLIEALTDYLYGE